VYQGKWLSTGISKGGQTTIFYRYFYPEDVDVSVPYVAPLNLALEEQRIYTFLDTVGDASCRNALLEVQKDVLKARDQVDALWFFMAGKDHGRARIRNMSTAEREQLVATLERWLEIEIED
jgi:hypothetical protein